jgi:hypothetical protein
MGFARPSVMEDTATSNDARQRRMDSVINRQLAFEVKKAAPEVSLDDAELLASAITEIVTSGDVAVNGEKVRAILRRKGRSPDAADRLARAIGL